MRRIMVIGSGPIIIGQAAEFDYAGTQACRSLREEGCEVILINSNPATIMTDLETADRVYIEPLNVDFCRRVIERERPDGLLATLGGQTGLNLASQLADAGILEEFGVQLLGTPLEAIRKAEDRELFRSLMRELREPVPESWIVESEEELEALLDEVPYPCIIRPAYTLGGTGGGVAQTRDELWEIGRKGLRLSMRSQLMIERSLLGWKEVEYEVMRDSQGTVITICNMENLDPMGVHTGDSIVVAPSQTLSDIEYHMLRTASLKIISALGIEGGCNVQLAVNPNGFDYYVIEVNPRVSRSSALASKATGYPIARVAAKIALGRQLHEIENSVTKTTRASFEPALDYCVVKIPRWPFDKFPGGDRRLSTQMKATGEVMAIDRTFESALMKAIRGLEVRSKDLRHDAFQGRPFASADKASAPMPDADLERAISRPTDDRLWALAEGLRRGWGVERVARLSNVDPWFLNKILDLVLIEGRLVLARMTAGSSEPLEGLIREAFLAGYPSPAIRGILGCLPGVMEALGRRPADEPLLQIALQDSAAIEPLLSLTNYIDWQRAEEVWSAPALSAGSGWGLNTELLQSVRLHKMSAERSGFDPYFVRRLSERTVGAMSAFLREAGQAIEAYQVQPVFKMVDTCAGEFASATPYYYSTFESVND